MSNLGTTDLQQICSHQIIFKKINEYAQGNVERTVIYISGLAKTCLNQLVDLPVGVDYRVISERVDAL